MRISDIARRSLTYYWRTNLAVLLGVATAVAVLAGALLVGDSVRGSLRDLVLARLGRADLVVLSTGLFGERLADALSADEAFAERFERVAPLVVAQGVVTLQETGRRVGQVRVYAVDDRFWQLHGIDVTGPEAREAYLSPALAEQLDWTEGGTVLVRVQRPTDIPLESLHGQRDDLGRSLRLTANRVLPPSLLGEFSLEAQQGEVRAVFVPLARLQRDLEVPEQVNALLVSRRSEGESTEAAGALETLVRGEASLEDAGFTLGMSTDAGTLIVGSSAGLLDEAHAAVASAATPDGRRARGVLTYLANTLRLGDREVPYSLVTAMDLDAVVGDTAPVPEGDVVVLNEWAADQLGAVPGDELTLDYYLWEAPGQLVTRAAALRVAAIVPTGTGDRDLAPTYPGITDSPSLDDWNPPFPVDLGRVRPVDEEYWERYRTTPKAFVPLAVGQRLWSSRYGALTSVRVEVPEGEAPADARSAYETRLRGLADPLALGLAVVDVRAASLEASRGTTDFGAYFVYFSFFLVVSGLLLAALFFKLGVEQRVREVGLLRAVGLGAGAVRRVFLLEGVLVAVAGSVVGLGGAVAYAGLLMYGLRSWWVGAVGTTALELHVSPVTLLTGGIAGVVAAVACVWWTLRSLGRISERSLLAGELHGADLAQAGAGRRAPAIAGVIFGSVGLGLLTAGAVAWIDRAAAFFGAGASLLVAMLALTLWLCRRPSTRVVQGRGFWPVSRLGLRSAAYRPARSVVSVAVIASATFILISVDAFRRGDTPGDVGRSSGVGGYSLLVETLLPVVGDPNSPDGREALNLFGLDPSTRIEPFRLLPGDDASCLNLYEPRNPRIIAPSDAFLEAGRFAFQASLATTDRERANPWLLLHTTFPDGAIPVIADANSLTYVLHRGLGDDIVLRRGSGEVRLRVVAALRDSILQGELVMAERHFVAQFPEQEGYRVLLVESGEADRESVRAALQDGLADLGPDVVGSVERLAAYHQVENTFLSTFQALGGLGLLLGTVGLATVLLRNVLERRRELALLGAVGYRHGAVLVIVLAENALLLGGGLVAGAVSAFLAIAPALAERGGGLPVTTSGGLLLTCVFAVGLLSSVIALRAATRAPLLAALRSE